MLMDLVICFYQLFIECSAHLDKEQRRIRVAERHSRNFARLLVIASLFRNLKNMKIFSLTLFFCIFISIDEKAKTVALLRNSVNLFLFRHEQILPEILRILHRASFLIGVPNRGEKLRKVVVSSWIPDYEKEAPSQLKVLFVSTVWIIQ
jgi:hypothetical protein